MKKFLLTSIIALLAAVSVSAQSVYICKDGNYTKYELTADFDITSYINKCDSIVFSEPQMDDAVNIVYSGTTAKVTIPSSATGVTCTSGTSSDVVISCTNVKDEITYKVSGTSENGSLTISGEYKMTVVLNGANITSSKGAAIDIQCGKRIAVVLAEGTENNLVDAASGSQKACLYTKGHFEFEGAGTLNVTGNASHAIASKEYTQLKKTVGAINIKKAANDAFHIGQYFQMNGGKISIDKNTTNDGIQAELTSDATDENNGQIIIKGGTIDMAIANAEDAKGIKADGDITISGGTINIENSSNGSRGIQTDTNLTINADDKPTTITINSTGGKCTVAADADDPHKCYGIKIDGDLTITGGSTTVTGKNVKVGGKYTITEGTFNGTIK